MGVKNKKMKCERCGEFFACDDARRKFCSKECAKKEKAERKKIRKIKKALKNGDIIICEYCKKKFPYSSQHRKYCSYECEYVDRRSGHSQSKQICWTCQNACGGCSWSSEFIPVKGWKAKPTKLKVQEGLFSDSYNILYCPEYVPDEEERR